MTEPQTRVAFGALAGLHIGLAVWMIVSPHSFFESIGSFETYNPHYVRDNATFELAFGAGAAIATYRRGWRVPILAVIAIQYAAHAVNHAFDVGRSNNGWAGPVDLVSLSLAAVQFAALLWLIARRKEEVQPR